MTGENPDPAAVTANSPSEPSQDATRTHVIFQQLIAFAGEFARCTGRGNLAVAGVLVLLSGATEGISLALLVPLVDLLGEKGGTARQFATVVREALATVGIALSLPTLIAVFVGLIIFRAVILGMRDTRLERLRLEFTDALRRRTYHAVAGASWVFLMRRRLSDILEVLTSQIDRIGNGTHFFLRLPALIVLGAFQLMIALLLSPLLTLGILCWGGLLLLLFRRRFGSRYDEGQRLLAANRVAFAEISDFLHALKLAKSHAAESRHVAAFEAAATRQVGQAMEFERSAVTMRATIQITAAVTLGAFVYLAVVHAQLATPGVVVMVLIFARLVPLLSELQQGWQMIAHMLPTFDALTKLRTQCVSAAEPISGTTDIVPVRREIRLSGISFRYEEARGPATLEVRDLAIAAGSTVAIVGHTGAGKTTLADILLGLVVPDSGVISIDGVALTESSRMRWRRSVGYVPQDDFLFNDTIRANLLWACSGASEEDIHWALSIAAASEFVSALPEGLDTVVGERGVRLSGGERQRLGLARALVSHPSLLILDEATSALDNPTERAVQSAIEQLHGSVTIVVIAHRITTIRGADRILVLEGGRLVQEGTWDALSQDLHGPFASLLGTP